MIKLYTESMIGNVHQAAITINKLGLAEYVLSIEYKGGNYSIAVFKMPAKLVYKLREENFAYNSDPHHDDPD